MARIQGYRCDGPKCQEFTATTDLPVHWMTVQVAVELPASARDNSFQVCSNLCLMRLARERHHAAVDLGDEQPATGSGRRPKKARDLEMKDEAE